MKKWNKPELLTLGVENTFEDVQTMAKPNKPGHTDATYHYCHNLDVNLPTCQDEQKNHSASGNKEHTFTGVECGQHGNGNSACCCYTAPNSPEMPIS